MTLASLLQQDSHDLDSGDGGEMLDTARSLFDFLGFLGWICQGFSQPLESRRVPLYSTERETGSDLHFLYVRNSLKDSELYPPEELSAHSAADPDRVL